MTRCQCDDAADRASSLYLAASHLYSREGNVFEHGDDGLTRYGWATLRATALQGLSSQPSDKEVAEAGEMSICDFIRYLYYCVGWIKPHHIPFFPFLTTSN